MKTREQILDEIEELRDQYYRYEYEESFYATSSVSSQLCLTKIECLCWVLGEAFPLPFELCSKDWINRLRYSFVQNVDFGRSSSYTSEVTYGYHIHGRV